MKNKIIVQETLISIRQHEKEDFISLTDIAKAKNADEPKDVVKNWLRNKNTIEFLGLWEQINNPDFKGVEFDGFKNAAGSNSFTLSPTKWIENTNAIGLISKTGKNGGTFAHVDIANLENLNSEYIKQDMQSKERLVRLNQIAIEQLSLLLKQQKKLENK